MGGASFNWVRQIDLETALEQQRLTDIVDTRQLVVKICFGGVDPEGPMRLDEP